MSNFSDYARYYDLIYRDKDYAGEAAYIHSLIHRFRPGARTILNLGCGSGRHDLILSDHGYHITGIDLSDEMLTLAKHNSVGREGVAYYPGDVRTIRLGKTFDVVVSLFHVLSYQTTNEDIVAAFKTAKSHLAAGSLFIFDCWYGPGVLSDRPVVRVKEREDDAIKVTRIATPETYPNDNTVNVNYHIFIRNKQTLTVDEIREQHRMRFLFLPEIRFMLDVAGFSVLDVHESFKPSTEASFTTWSLTVVAQA